MRKYVHTSNIYGSNSNDHRSDTISISNCNARAKICKVPATRVMPIAIDAPPALQLLPRMPPINPALDPAICECCCWHTLHRGLLIGRVSRCVGKYLTRNTAKWPDTRVTRYSNISRGAAAMRFCDGRSFEMFGNLRSMLSDLVNYHHVCPWNTANTGIGYYFLLRSGAKDPIFSPLNGTSGLFTLTEKHLLVQNLSCSELNKENICERSIELARLLPTLFTKVAQFSAINTIRKLVLITIYYRILK